MLQFQAVITHVRYKRAPGLEVFIFAVQGYLCSQANLVVIIQHELCKPMHNAWKDDTMRVSMSYVWNACVSRTMRESWEPWSCSVGLFKRWMLISLFKLQSFNNQPLVHLSWNYKSYLSSSSMVHMIVACLLLLLHCKCVREAMSRLWASSKARCKVIWLTV